MYISDQKPNINILGRLACDYYYGNERVNGVTLFSKIAIKKCADGEINCLPLLLLDGNYKKTINQLEYVYDDIINEFIGLYADNGHLIAHTFITYFQTDDFNQVVQINDIYVENKDAFKLSIFDGIDVLSGIYRQILTFAEEHIYRNSPNFDKIEIDVSFNKILLLIVQELGYEIDVSSSKSLGYKENNKGLKRVL
ncbi:MAG: hypothetical protein E7164_01995 [Firmicutes bacterium]|nr:hypothetical protein [Bacillota bacterium]